MGHQYMYAEKGYGVVHFTSLNAIQGCLCIFAD